MITITYFEVYSIKNSRGLEEPICVCLSESRAKEVVSKAEKGEYKFLTARSPYAIRIMEREYEPSAKDVQF
jgi:hypothetical protein